MKQMSSVVLGIGMVLAGALSHGAPGYVDSSSGSIVRTGFGDCLHTGRWSEANAIAECDPEIVAARDKVEVAAVETIVNRVRLEADTLFEFDSHELTPDGIRILDDLAASMTAADLQDRKIQITGYADRIGEEDYNLELSQRRAAAVRDHLVSQGVESGYVDTRGLGTADPVVACEGERGAALIECLAPNRRTEVEFSAMEVTEVRKEAPAE